MNERFELRVGVFQRLVLADRCVELGLEFLVTSQYQHSGLGGIELALQRTHLAFVVVDEVLHALLDLGVGVDLFLVVLEDLLEVVFLVVSRLGDEIVPRSASTTAARVCPRSSSAPRTSPS